MMLLIFFTFYLLFVMLLEKHPPHLNRLNPLSSLTLVLKVLFPSRISSSGTKLLIMDNGQI